MSNYIYKEPSISYRVLTTSIIIILSIAICLGSFLVAPKVGYILFFLVIIGVLGFLIYLHAKNTAYICKSCGHEFQISFWKDLLTAHSPGKKLVTCPQCSYKDYATEVIKKKRPADN